MKKNYNTPEIHTHKFEINNICVGTNQVVGPEPTYDGDFGESKSSTWGNTWE